MVEQTPSALDAVSDTRPNAARMYDYNLGGQFHLPADAEAMERVNALFTPGELQHCAQANRAFLRRAVRLCLDNGIDQFLDLGSGVPTVGNVHEVAHASNPDARVVYVDYESVAAEQTRQLLADTENAGIVQADLREPETVLDASETRRLLDFSRPVALLLLGALHYVAPEDDVHTTLAHYTRHLVPGSAVAISHLTMDGRPQNTANARREWNDTVADPMIMRSWEEVYSLFEGLQLVEPGLVWTSQWRPDPDEADTGWPVEMDGHWSGFGFVPEPEQ